MIIHVPYAAEQDTDFFCGYDTSARIKEDMIWLVSR